LEQINCNVCESNIWTPSEKVLSNLRLSVIQNAQEFSKSATRRPSILVRGTRDPTRALHRKRKTVEYFSDLVTNGDELAKLEERPPLATERIQ